MILIHRLAALVADAPSPNPTPGLREGLDESIISPGLAGFLAVFGVALAAVVLFYSLTGKLRRVKVRGAAADLAEGAEGPGPENVTPGAGGGAVSPSDDAGPTAPPSSVD